LRKAASDRQARASRERFTASQAASLGGRSCGITLDFPITRIIFTRFAVFYSLSLPPTGPLIEEGLREAVVRDVEGIPARVFIAEHLAAVALQTGRAKDKARLLQFVETGALDAPRFQDIQKAFTGSLT
jgi:hypothetical protein